jgi:hypothetical protein
MDEIGWHIRANMGEIKIAQKFWSEDLKRTGHFEDLGVDSRIILSCIFKRLGKRCWMGSLDSKDEASGGSFQHHNQSSGSIKGYFPHKKDSSPWNQLAG